MPYAFDVPVIAWLLCMEYTCGLMNHLSLDSLNGLSPLLVAFSTVVDISPYMCYHFWLESTDDSRSFPSKEHQCLGCFVGIAEQVDDKLTFLVMDLETGQGIPWSDLCPAKDPKYPNQKAQSNNLMRRHSRTLF